MEFFRKIKNKYLDFEHPPSVGTLVLFDSVLVAVILLVYALIQHVLPSHYFDSLLTPAASSSPVVAFSAAPVPTPVTVSSPAPDEAAKGTPEPETPDKWFPDRFTEEVILTDTSYKSPNVSVEIIEHAAEENHYFQHWFEADIYISDISCLQTFTHDKSNQMVGGDIRTLSELSSSIVAVNGDYASTTGSGIIIRNGEVLREEPNAADVCVLFQDGTMECYSPGEYDSEAVLKKGAWQAWTFGPSLLDCNGHAKTEFSSYYGTVLEGNPRTILGYYEPGHYCFVVVDGRQPGYATGYNMEQTSALMESLGCKAAYNLDGGRSSQMTFGTEYVNRPYKDGRYVSDIVLIRDLTE